MSEAQLRVPLLDAHGEPMEDWNGQFFADVFCSIKNINFHIDFPSESTIDLCVELSTTLQDQYWALYGADVLCDLKIGWCRLQLKRDVVFLCNCSQSIGNTGWNRFILLHLQYHPRRPLFCGWTGYNGGTFQTSCQEG